MSTDKKHKEPVHSEPTTGASDHHGHEDEHAKPASQAQPASLTQSHEEELEGIKMLALDSA